MASSAAPQSSRRRSQPSVAGTLACCLELSLETHRDSEEQMALSLTDREQDLLSNCSQVARRADRLIDDLISNSSSRERSTASQSGVARPGPPTLTTKHAASKANRATTASCVAELGAIEQSLRSIRSELMAFVQVNRSLTEQIRTTGLHESFVAGKERAASLETDLCRRLGLVLQEDGMVVPATDEQLCMAIRSRMLDALKSRSPQPKPPPSSIHISHRKRLADDRDKEGAAGKGETTPTTIPMNLSGVEHMQPQRKRVKQDDSVDAIKNPTGARHHQERASSTTGNAAVTPSLPTADEQVRLSATQKQTKSREVPDNGEAKDMETHAINALTAQNSPRARPQAIHVPGAVPSTPMLAPVEAHKSSRKNSFDGPGVGRVARDVTPTDIASTRASGLAGALAPIKTPSLFSPDSDVAKRPKRGPARLAQLPTNFVLSQDMSEHDEPEDEETTGVAKKAQPTDHTLNDAQRFNDTTLENTRLN